MCILEWRKKILEKQTVEPSTSRVDDVQGRFAHWRWSLFVLENPTSDSREGVERISLCGKWIPLNVM